ncbi:aminotransferase class III-fold pyridoxal phosphate-dependent enzyme [Caulobacter sp. 17J80-11]|uniref:aminotransferase class III-fold pyridoxal phosphate-dependent enzyme n=1 Tax=Caulobacter sp. 17J80-11 TaxID=2763502 RepID=UPI00165396CC|nr:aminotransferase class III-fold pyridoxal phosphate-dependent enzyme [Caulobacter sp. 17J80-11]MBC6982772.1 aminotransferase class III-fold pyridoxal phosphate-dependent enzyme [Caulobacter sp. 17J80-11]
MAQAQARLRQTTPRPAGPPAYATVVKTARRLHGALVTDAAGIERIDLHGDDGAVLLGWNDPQVEIAVAAAPSVGAAEAEAAERLADVLPCAEAVGFRTSVQLALADALVAAKTVTGRDGAFFCDDAVAAAGDVESVGEALDTHAGEVAALIIRPLDAPREFLLAAKRLARRDGVVLVFDESRTALRVHAGGAQALHGVAPDLAVVGASLANGRPLGAVAGAIELMKTLPASGPRPGAASLAAACATLDTVERADVPAALRVRGAEIAAEVEARLHAAGAGSFLEIVGDPTWSCLNVRARVGRDAKAVLEALTRRLYDQGVLSLGAHVPSLALGEAEIARVLAAYDAVLPELAAQVLNGRFDKPARRRTVA